MNNGTDNPTLDIVIRAAKHQIQSNLKHLSTKKPFKLGININDEELKVTINDIDHDGFISYDFNPQTDDNPFKHYNDVHWLILSAVGYKLSTTFEFQKPSIAFNPKTVYQALISVGARPSLTNFNNEVPSPGDIIVVVCAKDCKTYTTPYIARWKDIYAEPLMKGVGEDLSIHLHLNNLKFHNNRWISFDDHGY